MKNIAPVSRRLLSTMLDSLLYSLLYLLIISAVISADNINSILNTLLIMLFFFIIILPILIPTLSLLFISFTGGTFGKYLCGLEIVDKNGKRITLFTAFFRNYVGYTVSSFLFGLGFIWILKDKQKQGWHDMIAGTYVVFKRQIPVIVPSIALIILVFIDSMIFLNIFQKGTMHKKIYQDIINELLEEGKKSFNESPDKTEYKNTKNFDYTFDSVKSGNGLETY
jgi:uncharacterized RDD family membrane protein YckC